MSEVITPAFIAFHSPIPTVRAPSGFTSVNLQNLDFLHNPTLATAVVSRDEQGVTVDYGPAQFALFLPWSSISALYLKQKLVPESVIDAELKAAEAATASVPDVISKKTRAPQGPVTR